jgi:glycosyltransferase involved in cell wall biosynthesis
MYQTDKSILDKLNVQSGFVVINQCDIDLIEDYEYKSFSGAIYHGKFINTRERGLSNSRNMAIQNCPLNSICVICDDDEELSNHYPELILDAYENHPDADVISFNINYKSKRYDYKKPYKTVAKMHYHELLRVSSFQITFKRDRITECNIVFDKKMGAGTGNGGGEELKFVLDCRKRGLSIWKHTNFLCTILNTDDSTWFKGYTFDYFVTCGWSTRRLLGFFVGYVYIWYNAVNRRNIYCKDISLYNVIWALHKGFFQKR